MPHILNRRHALVVTALAIGMTATTAWAADPERGTRNEAKALTEAAAAHIGKVGSEQAFKDFETDPKWRPKDMFSFVQAMDGTMLYHGANAKLVGKNFIGVKDSTGKEFAKEMVAVAQKGSGWVDYQWANPATRKVEDKTAYILRINKPEGFVGVGIYR